jgi:hypothetical protein
VRPTILLPLFFLLGTAGPAVSQAAPRAAGWRGCQRDTLPPLLDPTTSHQGSKAVILTASTDRDFGCFLQAFPAAPYRGQKLRLSGWLRASHSGASLAGLWMRVDGSKDGTPFDNMDGRPIASGTDWVRVQITLPVPADAATVFIGGLLRGPGSLWVDDLALEIVAGSEQTTGSVLTGGPDIPPRLVLPRPTNLSFEDQQ